MKLINRIHNRGCPGMHVAKVYDPDTMPPLRQEMKVLVAIDSPWIPSMASDTADGGR